MCGLPNLHIVYNGVSFLLPWLSPLAYTILPSTAGGLRLFQSETGRGLAYSHNQKQYLLGCLSNPDVPLDNSASEQKIRKFVISRKNFVQIDTIAGAEASAILFSMTETVRANNLKPYEYFKYVLDEMPKHMNDDHRDMSFLDDLLPWSESLPAEIRKPK